MKIPFGHGFAGALRGAAKARTSKTKCAGSAQTGCVLAKVSQARFDARVMRRSSRRMRSRFVAESMREMVRGAVAMIEPRLFGFGEAWLEVAASFRADSFIAYSRLSCKEIYLLRYCFCFVFVDFDEKMLINKTRQR